MALNVENCPRCGRLFAKNFKDICPVCIKDIEKEYEKCLEYLRQEKTATIQEVSDATEVSVRQITKFIKEGRISIANNPNMMYPCEVCGVLIREGNMCDGCRGRLTRDLTAAAREERKAGEEGNKTGGAYGVIDKFRGPSR
ncbi:flagellar protein [Paenibacillus sp. alder61]|uniref:Flagellar protein n=1 Tax=Paenibacillus faecis TaxID=862114 RepID=A0A5D0CPQ9_9BACL|nr:MULTISPECIES: TIGR03826 family flagellar region protein [Paenibacillus]MCA1293999.1 flagellar protein [Paenibacillus sp. alder61]TYA11881.1 flagellar protein [Paenibacillus faecis]